MEHLDMLMGVIIPYANFAIFLALVIIFCRKPARAAAAKSREDFEKVRAEAAAARGAAQARLDELTARQKRLDSEIAEIKESARQAAEMEATKIASDAKHFAEHLKHEARRIADAEVEKARGALRQEIIDAVRKGAAAKIAADVKPDAHLSLVRKQINDMQTIKAEG